MAAVSARVVRVPAEPSRRVKGGSFGNFVAESRRHFADDSELARRLRHLTASVPQIDAARLGGAFDEAGEDLGRIARVRAGGLAGARGVADASSWEAMRNRLTGARTDTGKASYALNSRELNRKIHDRVPILGAMVNADGALEGGIYANVLSLLGGGFAPIAESFPGSREWRKFIYVAPDGSRVKTRTYVSVTPGDSAGRLSTEGIALPVEGAEVDLIDWSIAARDAQKLAGRRSRAARSIPEVPGGEGKWYGDMGGKGMLSAKYAVDGSGIYEVGSDGFFEAFRRASRLFQRGDRNAQKTIALMLAGAYAVLGDGALAVSPSGNEAAFANLLNDPGLQLALRQYHERAPGHAARKASGRVTAAAALAVRGDRGAAHMLANGRQKLKPEYNVKTGGTPYGTFGRVLHPGKDRTGTPLAIGFLGAAGEDGSGVHGDILCGDTVEQTTLRNDFGQFPRGSQRATVITRKAGDNNKKRRVVGAAAATKCSSGSLTGYSGARYTERLSSTLAGLGAGDVYAGYAGKFGRSIPGGGAR